MSIDNNEIDEMDFDLLDILGVTEQKVESITVSGFYRLHFTTIYLKTV